MLEHTPLWHLVLSEAEARGGGTRLGPVGGRIVADQLLGLLLADDESYLRVQPDWSPAGVLRPRSRRWPTVRYALGR